MIRFWGRANRNSAPRKRSVICSFWPFDRHKKSNPENYRGSEASEVTTQAHSQTRQTPDVPSVVAAEAAAPSQLRCDNLQTHSKRSLRSSRSHSRKRQVSTDLIDSVVNECDLSHLSSSRPAPQLTPATQELLLKASPTRSPVVLSHNCHHCLQASYCATAVQLSMSALLRCLPTLQTNAQPF